MIRIKVFEREDMETAVKVHGCSVGYRGAIRTPDGDVAFYIQAVNPDTCTVVEYEEHPDQDAEAKWEEFVKWTLSLGVKNIIGGLIQ